MFARLGVRPWSVLVTGRSILTDPRIHAGRASKGIALCTLPSCASSKSSAHGGELRFHCIPSTHRSITAEVSI